MRNVCLALFVLAFLPVTAFSADMYSVNSGATVQINEHGVCQRITNSHASGRPIMVPTRTATEWTTFRNNRPGGVAIANCPSGCGGASVGGYCWYVGGQGQSCTTVCSSRGGVNMAGTKDYAGSGGNLTRCKAVASALGRPSPVDSYDASWCGNLGCIITRITTGGYTSYYEVARCTPTTTEGATPGTFSGAYTAWAPDALSGYDTRVCACNN